MPEIRKGFHLDEFIEEWLPPIIKKNPDIIGFTVYTDKIWFHFLIHILFFAIGVYVRKQFNKWSVQ